MAYNFSILGIKYLYTHNLYTRGIYCLLTNSDMNIVLGKWLGHTGRGLEFGCPDPRSMQVWWLAGNFSLRWTQGTCGVNWIGESFFAWLRLYLRAGEKNMLPKGKTIQNPKGKCLVWLRLYLKENKVEEHREDTRLCTSTSGLHTPYTCALPLHTQACTFEHTIWKTINTEKSNKVSVVSIMKNRGVYTS